MKHVSDAWMVNTPTNGDFVLIEIRIDGEIQYGTLTDSALSEIAMKADDMSATAMNLMLLRAVQNFLRSNP